jgi:hypothetical protein
MSYSTDVLEGLLHLEEIDFPTYYSPGAHERAHLLLNAIGPFLESLR